MIENHLKSLPGDARGRKREFSENVSFTMIKPSFSRSEASQNEVFLERKSLRVPLAAQGRKNTPKKCDFRLLWEAKWSNFRVKMPPKNDHGKKHQKKQKKGSPGRWEN